MNIITDPRHPEVEIICSLTAKEVRQYIQTADEILACVFVDEDGTDVYFQITKKQATGILKGFLPSYVMKAQVRNNKLYIG